MKAHIDDRRSIARIYPPEVFATDAAQNQKQPANELVQGVRVASAPDRTGAFELHRASRQVGESGESDGAIFLAPYRPLAGDAVADDPRAGYEAFLDDIISAAQQLGFRQELSPGPGDARLRGLRQ